jgi:hypothetical protein
MNPPVLHADENSELTLNVYPANLLGFKIPFKEAEVQFVVEDGANLVELVYTMGTSKAIIRSKGIEGEAVIGIYSIPTGVPVSKVIIKIISSELVTHNPRRFPAVIIPVEYCFYKG